jgi:hypothetical protein
MSDEEIMLSFDELQPGDMFEDRCGMTKRPIDITDIQARVDQARRRYSALISQDHVVTWDEACQLENSSERKGWVIWMHVLERVKAGGDPLLEVLSR